MEESQYAGTVCKKSENQRKTKENEASMGCHPRRLKKVIFYRKCFKKSSSNRGKKKKRTLDPKGRTPPCRRLTCIWDELARIVQCDERVTGLSSAIRPKPATAAGIDAGDTWFCLQPVRKTGTTTRQAKEVATRHAVEE